MLETAFPAHLVSCSLSKQFLDNKSIPLTARAEIKEGTKV